MVSTVTSYWKDITKHCCNPKHLTMPLPWTFKDVYDDLMSSDITTLQCTAEIQTNTPMPFAARSATIPSPDHNSTKPSHSSTHSVARSTTIGIHRTHDGRKFVPHNNNLLSSARKPSCLLCSNKHVNPWHATEDCPYKHPTQILPKDVRKHVMQHNALHGAEKKNYTKDQDLHNAKASPPQAASAITTSTDTDQITTSINTSSENFATAPLPDVMDLPGNDEIVETEYFDIPLPPPMANAASISNSALYHDLEPDTIVTDPLQYLSYES
jgi:hypothetical protein